MLVRVLLIFFLTIGVAISQSLEVRSNDGLDKFLGNMSGNELDPNSISNPLGPYGNPLSADSIHNPLGRYGSPLSPYSPTNPLSVHGPKIVTPDGQYLGNLTRNRLDPNSLKNRRSRTFSPVYPIAPWSSAHGPSPKAMPPYSGYQPQPAQGGIVGPAPSGLLSAPRSRARRIADFLESYRAARDRKKAAAR